MSITLVLEDGSIVDGANTYAELQTVRDYADNRGFTVNADDTILCQHMLRAMDYLAARECQMIGDRIDIAQALSWPRTNYTYKGFTPEEPTDEDGDGVLDEPYFMPTELVNALAELCVQIEAGVELWHRTVTSNEDLTGQIKKEELPGPLKVEYSERNTDASFIDERMEGRPVIIQPVEGWLRPLLEQIASFETVRI